MNYSLPKTAFVFMVLCLLNTGVSAQVDLKQFINPPQQAKPWVYWMWINGNISKESVTKDLEAMQRVGIGGALALDLDQWTPQGAAVHMNKEWVEVFRHAAVEARRLGMEVSTNNGPGYWGSGGSWITPDLGMQWVVSSEIVVKGGKEWIGKLPSPGKEGCAYRDIAVIALGVVDTIAEKRFLIPDFAMKSVQNPGNAGEVNYAGTPFFFRSVQWPGHDRYLAYRGTQSAPLNLSAPASACIPMEKVLNLTGKMASDGTLSWDVPEGEWTIIRFGHQFTGSCIGPVIQEVVGPETDKLSKEATRFHFNEMVKRLQEEVGAEGKEAFGIIHIDSWEGGGQNWTPRMAEEFMKRRGYDIIPYLPILTGRVLGNLQETERFLFDLRTTVSELFVENYVQEFQRLAHEQGLKLSFESYTTIGNDLNAAEFVDLPMAEFWVPLGWAPPFYPTIKSMSSAAHLKGRTIVGAEAMTSSGSEKWLLHPATIKHMADEAFCGGINRLVFHRYSAQYFDLQGPGMQMGPWGLHYERTNTWWEFSKPWHDYVARSQYMLQQGTFRADVLNLLPEEPLYRFQNIPLSGYDYDVLGSDAFRRLTATPDGLYMPGRPPYRLLLLSHLGTMSVEMLRRIRELVADGAAILGDRPQSTPGLKEYWTKNSELRKLADELWGTTANVKERRVGKGTVFCGITPEEALLRRGIRKDFDADQPLQFIHRTEGDTEIYFVANTTDRAFTASCTFRVAGKVAEIWDAEDGKRHAILPMDRGVEETTTLLLPFGIHKSYFVLFRPVQSAENLPLFPVSQKVVNPVPVEGDWKLSFPKGWGAPKEVVLPGLISWSEHPDEGVRHFSGTALYRKEILIPREMVNCGMPLILDLGDVEVMARVVLNENDLGIAWRAPYRFDLTDVACEGTNKLEIEVVNLWPNRLIGDDKLPDDCGFSQDGSLHKWPEWLLKNKKRPSGRKAFTTRRLWTAEDGLLRSGIIGPVVIYNQGE